MTTSEFRKALLDGGCTVNRMKEYVFGNFTITLSEEIARIFKQPEPLSFSLRDKEGTLALNWYHIPDVDKVEVRELEGARVSMEITMAGGKYWLLLFYTEPKVYGGENV